MTKAQRSAKQWRKSVEKDLRAVGTAFTAAGVAAAAGAGVLAASAASTSKDMRELVREAEILNTTAGDLSAWEYAFEAMGGKGGKVRDIFKDLNDKVGDFARTGGGEAADVFEQLGLQAADFIGLAPDQALLRIGEALDGLSQNEKTFFMESIADDASRLIPLLDNSAERFRTLADEGKNFGAVVTSEQAEVAQGFDQMLERASNMVSGFQTQLGAELSPTFEGVLNWLDEITAGFGGPREAAQALAMAIVTAMRDSVQGVQVLTSGLEDAYDMYLGIREIEAQAKAIGGTINNMIEGDDTLPDGFMDLQQIQAERAQLASGEGIGSDAVASLDRLLEHMDAASKSPALPELNDNAIAAAANVGILANSVDDAAAAMTASRDNLIRQMTGAGVVPTNSQGAVPELAAALAAGLNLSSITPMSADQFETGGVAPSMKLDSAVQAVAGATGGGSGTTHTIHFKVNDQDVGTVQGDDAFAQQLADVLQGVAGSVSSR
ncbi:hypothetical protein QWY80_00620 [Halomonas ramblicola]|nr:hypothetical protein [Halomonas ramblicola]